MVSVSERMSVPQEDALSFFPCVFVFFTRVQSIEKREIEFERYEKGRKKIEIERESFV